MSLVILEDVIKKRMRDVSDSDQAKMCKVIGEKSNTIFTNAKNMHFGPFLAILFAWLTRVEKQFSRDIC
jgi:aromatic ring-opening dioxygenase catalytic subunit (LigB family)